MGGRNKGGKDRERKGQGFGMEGEGEENREMGEPKVNK
jgi:hypothetical protein